MKLTRLTVHRYRDVAPGTELAFSPSLTLVLGDNGSGRTALLELVSTVLCADFSGLLREAFSLEYTLDFPGMELRVRARNTPASAAPRPPEASPEQGALLPLRVPQAAERLEPLLELTLRLHAPECTVVMSASDAGLGCEVDGRSVYARTLQWTVLGRSVWTLLFMTAQYVGPELKERLKPLLRRTFLLAPARFGEALEDFERIGAVRYAMEMQGEDVFPLGLMALPTWMPAWLREQVERGPPAEALELRHDARGDTFLERFVRLAGLASGTLRVELLERRTFEGGGRLAFGRFGLRFTRPDGSALEGARLGFGHKRLLSFLYYLDVNEDFALLDELANGLHPRVLAACMGELGGRQAFLASHNPLPLEHVRLDTLAQARASLIHCEGGQWAQPTAEVASRLLAAHREGRPLAELLRAHGLW